MINPARLAPQLGPRPRARTEPPGPRAAQAGARITTCTLCALGIYAHQARTWLRKPAGLSHDECIGRALTEGTVEIWA